MDTNKKLFTGEYPHFLVVIGKATFKDGVMVSFDYSEPCNYTAFAEYSENRGEWFIHVVSEGTTTDPREIKSPIASYGPMFEIGNQNKSFK